MNPTNDRESCERYLARNMTKRVSFYGASPNARTVSPLRSSSAMKRHLGFVTLALGLVVAGGCGTFERAGSSARPWDRPTKEELYPGYFIPPVGADWTP